MTIGEKIKKLRKEKKWSQTELGKKIGGDARKICQYENGKYMPSTVALIKLSEIFGVTIDYIVRDNIKNIATSKISDLELLKQFEQIDKMDKKKRKLIGEILDSLILKTQLSDMIQSKR